MIFEDIRKKIQEQYGVDVINDVLLADDYHIVFCFDFKKLLDAEMMILVGDISAYGFNPSEPLYVRDIIEYVDMDNPVSEVIGKDRYIEYLFDHIEHSDDISEIYFPVKGENMTLWVACSIQTIQSGDDIRLVYGRVNWISEIVPDGVKYYQNTYKDILTNMFSLEALKYHLKHARATAHSFGLYFDIDNFKRINDIFGHRYGDKYLVELGQRFISESKENEIYYRIGGDEFFVYLIDHTEQQAYDIAMQIIYDVETLNAEGQQAEVSASVGIVPIIGSDFDIDELLDLADRTMYHAKDKGKGNISFARDV